MCLAVPALVKEINESVATVDIEGNTRSVNLSMLDGVKVGEFVLVHAGFAIGKYSPEEAEATLQEIAKMRELQKEETGNA